jgi:hypothetical protein
VTTEQQPQTALDRTPHVERYLRGLELGDGPGVAAMFVPDGTIDDFRGGHRSGREAVAEFITGRRDLAVEAPLNLMQSGDRVNVYGRVVYADGEVAQVRWVFHFDGELISHVCNSRVEWLHGVS